MSTEISSPFVAALPAGVFTPEQIPVGFHTMDPHPLQLVHLPQGESRPHRARLFTSEPPPKPTSRCFPG